jgi:hypothetical protein
MKNKYMSAILILIAFLFFQCHKEISYIGNPDTSVTVNPDPITATVQGNIVDENNLPAAGVAITAGTSTAITDANGFFHINNASLDKNTSLVTAHKDGYFKAYRVFAATSGCNQVVIKLIKQTLAGTIKSSSGGEVSLTNGSKINLPANGIVNASGSNYSGDIKVYASYINPTSSDIFKIIPGSLVANDKNGKRVLLSSYGMLAVELQSPNGEKLQIKQGNVATLTIPIPSSAIAKDPAAISLWYIDEKTGIWQEEGTATKNGSAYTGTVKHFSFWNCDYPMDAVNLSITLKTPDSLPLVNAPVEITASNGDSTTSAYGWTDSLGQIKGLVPANQNLTLQLIDNCNYPFYQQNIAPLTQSTNLGTIIVNVSGNNLFTLKGTLVDCNGNAVNNGYAIINFDGFTHYVAGDASGNFITNLLKCPGGFDTCTVIGVDGTAQQQGQEVSIAITPPQVSGGGIPITDAGDIIACGTSSVQYINYTIDGVNYNITRMTNDSSFYGRMLPNYTQIGGSNPNVSASYRYIDFVTAGASVGTFPLVSLGLSVKNDSTLGHYPPLVKPFNITFTKYPLIDGEFCEGNFSGEFIDSSTTHTISVTFRMRRN